VFVLLIASVVTAMNWAGMPGPMISRSRASLPLIVVNCNIIGRAEAFASTYGGSALRMARPGLA
jgi:Na+-translocating ferredoxin:NAD+ oxidoreductase RnfE subunit